MILHNWLLDIEILELVLEAASKSDPRQVELNAPCIHCSTKGKHLCRCHTWSRQKKSWWGATSQVSKLRLSLPQVFSVDMFLWSVDFDSYKCMGEVMHAVHKDHLVQFAAEEQTLLPGGAGLAFWRIPAVINVHLLFFLVFVVSSNLCWLSFLTFVSSSTFCEVICYPSDSWN